jgi:flagellar hook-associated protein 3 FlgL
MRINPDPTSNLLTILSIADRQQQTAMLQMSSGRRVQVASDDPAASAALTLNSQQQAQQDQFLQNISSIRQLMSASDSALSGVVQALTRAVTIGVQGATGTVSPDNRLSLAKEVDGIRDQVLSLANTSFRGVFIFSGTNVTTQPFVLDSSSPSGVRYDGNQQVNSVFIGEGHSIPTGVAGRELFADPASDVFASLQNLTTALNSNDPDAVDDATAEVRSALTHISNLRVTYRSGLNQLDSDEQFLNSAKLQSQAREDELVGADPAESMTQMQQAQYARDATLAAIARTRQVSLLDYLK